MSKVGLVWEWVACIDWKKAWKHLQYQIKQQQKKADKQEK